MNISTSQRSAFLAVRSIDLSFHFRNLVAIPHCEIFDKNMFHASNLESFGIQHRRLPIEKKRYGHLYQISSKSVIHASVCSLVNTATWNYKFLPGTCKRNSASRQSVISVIYLQTYFLSFHLKPSKVFRFTSYLHKLMYLQAASPQHRYQEQRSLNRGATLFPTKILRATIPVTQVFLHPPSPRSVAWVICVSVR